MRPPLVIYHANCPDGWCAAWVASRALTDAELFEGYYGQPPPYDLAKGRPVIIVDFSYPRESLEKLKTVAFDLVVLDHHKTAEANLKGLPYCQFDMNRSGAGMAWDYFHPGQPRPWPVDYAEDRDLWRHSLPYSMQVNAYLQVAPRNLDAWDNIAAKRGEEFTECYRIGEFLMLKTKAYIESLRKNVCVRPFHGHMVPVVNAPQFDVSDLLDSFTTGYPFAVAWWQRSDGVYQYSLRSRGGFDVSEVAQRYGGGGHLAAAGFQSNVLVHL